MMQQQRSCEINPKETQTTFTISQVAHMTGVSAKAIRYYESVGLLPHPARASNRYRCYGTVDVNRLILLRRLRDLGVPLTQVRSLLTETSNARCFDVQQELLRLVHARLVTLDQEIAALHQLRKEIEVYQQKLTNCHPDETMSFRSCHDISCIDPIEETNGKEKIYDCC